MADLDQLRADNLLSDVAMNFGVPLRKDGKEWEACCPFHQEDTPSFTIFVGKDGAQRFHCFGCGEKGDVIDFVKAIKGCDTREAIKVLGGEVRRENVTPRARVEVRDTYAGITPLPPVGVIKAGVRLKLYNPKREKFSTITPSMVFPYRSQAGELLGYVLRNDFTDERGKQKKETPMVMFVRLPDGTETWSRYPFPKPRGLYRLENIQDDGKQVVIAEGEKCADVGAAITGRLFVSWAGGTQGVAHADWSSLAGRSVVIWPDADKPGVETAENIARVLHGLGCTIKVMDVSSKSDGWDIADAASDGWTRAEIDGFMRDNVRPWSPSEPEPEPPRGEPEPVEPPPYEFAPYTEADAWAADPYADFAEPQLDHSKDLIEYSPEKRRTVPASGRAPNPMHFRAWGGDEEAIRDWAYLSSDALFCNVHTGERMGKASFDMIMPNVVPMVEIENGKGETENKKYPASRYLMEYGDGVVCSSTMYRPDVTDMMAWVDGILFLNSFLPSSVPSADPAWENHPAWRVAHDHIHNVIPDGAEIVIKWMAHNVQFPGRKILWAPIIVGEQGDGKTTIAKVIQMAMGRKNVQPVGAEELFSDYTSWAEGACVRVLEELHQPGANKGSVVDKLKVPITNDEVPVVGKGDKAKTVANVTNYIGLTNYMDALRIPDGDRRFGVWKTRFADRAQVVRELTGSYWKRLHDAIGSHPTVLRGWLLSIDLSGFDRFEAPESTMAKRAMIDAARAPVAADIREAIEIGGHGVGREAVATDCLNDVVKSLGNRGVNTTIMANVLREMGWLKHEATLKWDGKTRRCYYLPGPWSAGLEGAALSKAIRDRLSETLLPHDPDPVADADHAEANW